MAVDLDDYVPSLQREVNPPGTAIFDVSDDVWVGYLTDAFWEARMDGFMAGYTCDEDGSVTPLAGGGADLPRQYVALIVLYAGVRILRTQILNTKTLFRAKAGPTEFEQQNSATMLAEMLKQLAAAKQQLIDQIQDVTPVYGWDAVVKRVLDGYFYLDGPVALMGG